MNKKKLVIIHHCDGIGGAGISLLNVYNMVKDEYDTTVYIPHSDSRISQLYQENGVELRAFNDDVGMISSYSGGPKIFSRTFVRNFLRIRKSRKTLKSILEKEKPDIVAVNSMTLTWAGKVIKESGVKSVCFIRETFVDNLGMGLIKYQLDKWFDCSIFLSEHDLKTFGTKTMVTGVVHNCVRQEELLINLTREESCKRIGIQHDRFNVLFVGGNNELKGWSVIRAAMEQIEDPKIRLIVAGAQDNERNAGEHNHNTVFIGLRDDMPMVYKACDVLVFPSIEPHQARPVLEAGVFGLPVIISDFEETSEFVTDGKNGLVFKPKDSRDLAKKIKRLYYDRDLCRLLGIANKDEALKKHDFNNCKIQLISLLAQMK